MRGESLEAISFDKKEKKMVAGLRKGYIFGISDTCTGDRIQRKFTDMSEGHAAVVSYKFEEYHLPGAGIFPICTQLSS